MDLKVLVTLLSLFLQHYAVNLPAVKTPPPAAVMVSSKAINHAVEANKDLRYKLKWTFAGTHQQGWYLYVPLVCAIIDCPTGADTPQFAVALAAWQQKQGLNTTGVLDQDTWQHMVEYLQSNRLQSREYPASNELQVVSVSEFFDPTRPDDLRKVHMKAYQAFQRMLTAARADKTVAAALADSSNPEAKNYFKIISSWRSREYQEQLRKRQGGSLGRVALAKNSPHFTGRALDIYVGGLPVSTDNNNRVKQVNTAVYRWLVRNAARFGFQPYFYEPWHWEYVGEPVKLEADTQ